MSSKGFDHAAATAIAAYALPEPVRVEPIRQLDNAVFAVTAGDADRYALRVHRPRYRPPSQTLAELTVLEAVHEPLAREGVRVPRPVRTAAGDLSVAVEILDPDGDAITVQCDLLSWVDGEVRRPGGGLGPRGLHHMGMAMASLHRACQKLTGAGDLDLPVWDAVAMFTEDSPFRPGRFVDRLPAGDLPLFGAVAEATAEIFAGLGRDPEAYGLIHNDFVLGNCHTVRTGSMWSVGVFDFDECGWGHYLYDLAPILGNLSDYPAFRTLRAAFLEGYRSVRELPVELEAHLPTLMAARHASQCLWVLGLANGGAEEIDAAEHIAHRMRQMRQCLALGSR